MKLTRENVRQVALQCFYPEGTKEMPADARVVDGIMARYAFQPTEIEKNKRVIAMMLDQLSDGFKTNGGGGMSFLNACLTKDGEHWGEHPDMELLFVLGQACKLARAVPREMWRLLPGGMPYYQIDSDALSAAMMN